jgi:hypothetical protein
MLTLTATFDVTMLYFVAANIICILGYVLMLKRRSRVIKRNSERISTTIVAYFRENGSEVAVECISRDAGQQFVALVTSKPNKRFRNSHIVELVLATHVRKVCGLDLERVYWCFPVKAKQDAAPRDVALGDAHAPGKGEDDYFDEEGSTLTRPPGYRVRELSRERFDKLVTQQRSRPNADLEVA